MKIGRKSKLVKKSAEGEGKRKGKRKGNISKWIRCRWIKIKQFKVGEKIKYTQLETLE